MARRVTVLPAGEGPLRRGRPWVLRREVEAPNLAPGETVELVSRDQGTWLGRGAWLPRHAVAVRLWTTDPNEKVDAAFFHQRIENAVAYRQQMGLAMDKTSAFRMVDGDADRVQGLIVDKLGPALVCQFTTIGAQQWRSRILTLLHEQFPEYGLWEEIKQGGPQERLGSVGSMKHHHGPQEPVFTIQDTAAKYCVDLTHRCGPPVHLEHRDNHTAVAQYLAGKRVLDCFSGPGGFTLHAALVGATSVTALCASSAARDALQKNLDLNKTPCQVTTSLDQVTPYLEAVATERRAYDAVLLNNPSMRGTIAETSARYTACLSRALRVLSPNGTLVVSDPWHAISFDHLSTAVAEAAVKEKRTVRITSSLSQSRDFPVLPACPETRFLSGLVCHVA